MIEAEEVDIARQHTIVWGLHCVVSPDMPSLDAVFDEGGRIAVDEGFAQKGDQVVLTAGVLLGQVLTAGDLPVQTSMGQAE